MVVKQTFGDAGCTGNCVHGRALKALSAEDFRSGVKNFSDGARTARTAADLSSRAGFWKVGFHETGPRVQIIASNTPNTPLGAGFPSLLMSKVARAGGVLPVEGDT